MSTPYTYWASERHDTYYARKKRFRTLGDGEVTAILTPLTSGTFFKPAIGPRGGKARRECYRQLWTVNGRIYKAAKTQFAPNDYGYSLVPFSGSAYNRFDLDQPAVVYRNGVLVG